MIYATLISIVALIIFALVINEDINKIHLLEMELKEQRKVIAMLNKNYIELDTEIVMLKNKLKYE